MTTNFFLIIPSARDINCHSDPQLPVYTIDEQESVFDTDNGDGKSDTCPVELFELGSNSVCNREEKNPISVTTKAMA